MRAESDGAASLRCAQAVANGNQVVFLDENLSIVHQVSVTVPQDAVSCVARSRRQHFMVVVSLPRLAF
jgi:hypothetical protein